MPFGLFRKIAEKFAKNITSGPQIGDTRITYIEGKGYLAQIYEYYIGSNRWVAIDTKGENTLHIDGAISNRYPESYFSETEEGAGRAINHYHHLFYEPHKVIWNSREDNTPSED